MNRLINVFNGILFCIVVFLCASCRKDVTTNLTLEKNGKTIWGYLSNNSSYSILTQALEITKVANNLKVYGNMTLFAPTDEAFKKYFARKGISNISEVNPDTLRNLLNYHIYNELYSSSFFVQGTLPTTTVSGSYINFDISKGLRATVLNGNVKIDSLDLSAANGFVHVIDDVLEPASKTLYEWLKSQPDYSIMLEAFEKTGNADELLKTVEYDSGTIVFGKPITKWRTVFLETNAVLKQANIGSFDDLAARFSQNYNAGKNYTNLTDSLNMFIRFHVLKRKYFISDFSDTYLESACANNFLVFSITNGISINKHTVERVSGTDVISTEVKVGLNLDKSNVVTKNGFVNSVTSLLSIYTLKPILVKVLFAGNLFERGIKLVDGTASTFSAQFSLDVNNNNRQNQAMIPWLKWAYTAGFIPSTPTVAYFKDIAVSFSGGNAGYWYELTTGLVVKGDYEVYVSYFGQRRDAKVAPTNATFQFDGKQLGDIVNLRDPSDAFGNVVEGDIDANYRRKLGTVNLSVNATHVFRVDGIADNVTSWYCMELVPVKN